jgi:hypothetical protein
MTAMRGDSGWAGAARNLYLVAMAVFLVTITIGIPNALNVVTFDRNQILTHVHSGTVGWLTLSIVATSFLLFRAADRRLAVAMGVCVPIYVAAFYTGNFAFRALAGVVLLLVIAWLVAWVWRTYLGGERALPRLGIALALTTFAYGAVMGVVLQVSFAMGTMLLPGNSVGAHAGAMTFGYLALAGMAVLEWKVLGTAGLPRAGVVQFVALFIGGLILSAALLGGAEQIGGMFYLLAQLVAVVLFGIRVLPRALRTSWAAATGERHIAAAALWIVVALVLFMAVVAQFIANPTSPDALNEGLLVAGDHSVYIGVITNVTFALILTLVASVAGGALVGQLVFWGMNLGLAVFVVGLAAQIETLKMVGAPVMGVALLVGLATFALGLLAQRGEPATADPAQPATA